MVESVASSAKYQEFEQKHNRHLNMLSENVSSCNSLQGLTTLIEWIQDRNLRRQALIEFRKAIEASTVSDEVIEFFYREKLVRRLVLTLED